MSIEKPAYGIRGGLAHDAGSGSYVLWDNTKCNPLAPTREQTRSAWEDGYASAKREWVGLTDEELEPLCDEWRILFGSWTYEFARAIEAQLKQRNT